MNEYWPEVVAGLLYGVEDGLPKPLALRHGLLRHHFVLLREGVPRLRHHRPAQLFILKLFIYITVLCVCTYISFFHRIGFLKKNTPSKVFPFCWHNGQKTSLKLNEVRKLRFRMVPLPYLPSDKKHQNLDEKSFPKSIFYPFGTLVASGLWLRPAEDSVRSSCLMSMSKASILSCKNNGVLTISTTWVRDTLYTCDGFSAIRFFLHFLK